MYLVMTPFLWSSSGGAHFIKTDVDDSASIVIFVGLPEGAVIIVCNLGLAYSKTMTLKRNIATHHPVAYLE